MPLLYFYIYMYIKLKIIICPYQSLLSAQIFLITNLKINLKFVNITADTDDILQTFSSIKY